MKPAVVLCPVDFSPPSRVAFAEACSIARDAGARLVLLNVNDAFYPSPELPILPADVLQKERAGRLAQLTDLEAQARAGGVAVVEAEIVDGPAWDRILAAARTAGADLIVMGTHGRTGLRHVLLGSVAEKVVRHAPCSVLVVRTRPRVTATA